MADGKTAGSIAGDVTVSQTLGDLPPPWVRLVDAPTWIERIYHISANEVRNALILALRGGRIGHRVSRWRVRPQRWDFEISTKDRQKAPEWMRFTKAHGQVYVFDWEMAQFDPASGTVISWGENECHIEIEFAKIEMWVKGEFPEVTSNHFVRGPLLEPTRVELPQTSSAASRGRTLPLTQHEKKRKDAQQYSAARGLFTAMKFESQQLRPTFEDAKSYLIARSISLTRTRLRILLKEVWREDVKRGPRPAKSAKLATEKPPKG